ncbi:MAG: hypothetical protein P4L43_15070 [Syntrophobacteraceae bacterium]|nr:hypothetical protein [Syntrophobacteraceae bacterium]
MSPAFFGARGGRFFGEFYERRSNMRIISELGEMQQAQKKLEKNAKVANLTAPARRSPVIGL